MIGDNGAGKSSLIKALSGAVQPDEGEITLEGKRVHFESPLEARGHGIECVYQTLAMSPALSIADNMFMGRELRKPGIMGSLFRQLDRPAMEKFAREKLTELGLMTIQNINQAVETLSGGPAPERGRRSRRGIRLQGGDPGRADRRTWRQGKPPGAGADPRRALARDPDHPDQP